MDPTQFQRRLDDVLSHTVDLGVGVARSERFSSAQGSFGDVYKGRYLPAASGSTEQIVALKMVRPRLMADPRTSRRVIHEIIVWSRLSHPRVLPLLGISTKYKQQLCMVSPWQENGNAMEYLRACYFESEDGYYRVFRLIEGLVDGLVYLHARYVVHGDLKGDNVLVSRDGSALLADFGLSTLIDETGSSSVHTGSLNWASPERLEPEEFGTTLEDARSTCSDVYSLGMTMYEIISGSKPYYAVHSQPGIIRAIISGERPSWPNRKRLGHTVADHVTCITEWCWVRNPEERPSALDVQRELTGDHDVISWYNTLTQRRDGERANSSGTRNDRTDNREHGGPHGQVNGRRQVRPVLSGPLVAHQGTDRSVLIADSDPLPDGGRLHYYPPPHAQMQQRVSNFSEAHAYEAARNTTTAATTTGSRMLSQPIPARQNHLWNFRSAPILNYDGADQGYTLNSPPQHALDMPVNNTLGLSNGAQTIPFSGRRLDGATSALTPISLDSGTEGQYYQEPRASHGGTIDMQARDQASIYRPMHLVRSFTDPNPPHFNSRAVDESSWDLDENVPVFRPHSYPDSQYGRR